MRRVVSRRGLIGLGAAGLLTWATRAVFPTRAAEDPNDFPVSNFGLDPTGIDLATWRLEVRGAVQNPLSLRYEELLQLPRERHRYPITCIEGWSEVCDWEGIPIVAILEIAKPVIPLSPLRFLSVRGYPSNMAGPRYTRTGAMVATHVGGAPIAWDHGFPARLIVPDVVGEECVKWLGAIEVLSE